MVCAICGKEIAFTPSVDHVLPRSLYKWSEAYLSKTEFNNIKSLIESSDNKVMTHEVCNAFKEDEIPLIETLYLSDVDKSRLNDLEKSLKNIIVNYRENKTKLLLGQNRRCASCGCKIKNEGVLRRINPKRKRTWDNACIVCHKCNLKKRDFMKKRIYDELS